MVGPLSEMVADERKLVASISRDSYFDFVRYFWKTVVQDEPVWNWHIRYLCFQLQKVAERVFARLPREYDLVINISPGSTKSLLCSVFFTPWVWTRMPSATVICASYNDDLALLLALKSRDVVLSALYRECFPYVQIRSDQKTKSIFMTTQGGMRVCAGVGGGITGKHGDFLIVDDPLNPNEAVSEANLNTANRWMSETLPTRKQNKEVSPTILIMQRLHQNDPTQLLIDQSRQLRRETGSVVRLKHICLPGELTDQVKPRKMMHYYKDSLMDPIRLSRRALDELRIRLGEWAYAGQILQQPVPMGGGIFQWKRITIGVPEDKWVSQVRYWDKAGTQGGRGAYTCGVKMAKDRKGRFWILDVVRGRWESAQREKIIRQTAEADGRGILIGVEQEPGSGGKESAENTARNLAGFRVIIDRPTGNKELRADPFSVQVNNGNVSLVRAGWNREYLKEMEYFPNSTYKDQVDASSGAFNSLTTSCKVVGKMW